MKEYIRYKKRKKNGGMVPIGAVMIGVEDGIAFLGWSLCCKADHFSYTMARKVARDRMHTTKRSRVILYMPETLKDTCDKLVNWLADKDKIHPEQIM